MMNLADIETVLSHVDVHVYTLRILSPCSIVHLINVCGWMCLVIVFVYTHTQQWDEVSQCKSRSLSSRAISNDSRLSVYSSRRQPPPELCGQPGRSSETVSLSQVS